MKKRCLISRSGGLSRNDQTSKESDVFNSSPSWDLNQIMLDESSTLYRIPSFQLGKKPLMVVPFPVFFHRFFYN